MTTTMTKLEREAYLKEPRIAVLSLTDPARGPLATAMWYDHEPGGDLWLLMQRDSRKGRLIELSTRLSLCIHNETTPYRYLSVEGPVTAIEPYGIDKDLLPMAQRYLGAERGRAFADKLRATASGEGSIKVVVRPERWLTLDYGKSAFWESLPDA